VAASRSPPCLHCSSAPSAVLSPVVWVTTNKNTRTLRPLAATLVLCCLGLLVAGSAGAADTVPPSPPKFWSAARCERAMLALFAPPQQVLCVGTGGPSSCRWTSGHRARIYSEFRVFTRHRQTNVRGVGLKPGVVRSFTLATRARPGFVRVIHHWGDQYVDWPADFYKAHRRLLATDATPARFRSIVAPMAARLTQNNASGCTGR
jgi:hypothetical protein